MTSPASPLAPFHPLVQQWWRRRFAVEQAPYAPPTPAQADGWAAIRAGHDTLIAAPTGSGKTLAAFLHSIDALTRESLENGGLPDEVRVVYVSPLKALSGDIHRNLAEPRREMRELAQQMGLPPVHLTAAVRSGDTPASERAAMLRKPPHILVTTPESLYLLLTAERSREMLRTATTVIVDEIHAVIESRRGPHLALSLERLDHVAGRRLQRIGLSATQKPIEEVASFLVGVQRDGTTLPARAVAGADGAARPGSAPVDDCPARSVRARPAVIVDRGHFRELDVALEMPLSPLEAVMSGEVWQEVYDRIAALANEHRTTLVFVNTRRLAERAARALSERLGGEAVTAHHGSLAKEVRLDAEERLKNGTLRVLVATASLELGIDIGHVDLVVQLGSPHRIASFLQRVGRSGHTVSGTPKGRLVPLSRDDLVECTALLAAVRAGELDRIIMPDAPIDVLAQQIAAEVAAAEWDEEALYALVTHAWPYRNLSREQFGETVQMIARGFSTQRGRRGALIHYDPVNRTLRARKATRILSLTSGGAIPEVSDYRVVLEPEGVVIGSVNEDFAVESMAGDVFQLGNTSWRVLQIQQGTMRVADAEGAPPNIPFWFGEAPARSDELSAAVGALREDVASRLVDRPGDAERRAEVVAWLVEAYSLPQSAAEQLVLYLGDAQRVLGALPTQHTLVLERFFDDGGGMQLLLHAPFGSRVNRAWGLALRKKFCQSYNFELQAVATEEGVLLSLGPTHSFPLEDVFRYLNPETVRETLIQAMLDSPIFETRWRWNSTISLAVRRNSNGRKVPAQLQRMDAEDLLTAVFPDATACFENIQGEREVPSHPLVDQAIRDCLEEAMDLPHLVEVLKAIRADELTLVARDTPEPSTLAAELVNARVYQFLDDAPLEERRTLAVQTRRATEPSSANDLGALDADAIERVRAEAWPYARDVDELQDALVSAGVIVESEAPAEWGPLFERLVTTGRATRCVPIDGAPTYWLAVERLPEARTLWPDLRCAPDLTVPPSLEREWPREEAAREIVRSRTEVSGPVTIPGLAILLALDENTVEGALLALEAEGRVLRGRFTPGLDVLEWCDRRLLARIHRYTLNRLRAEIRPVSLAEYMRFLFRWQRVDGEHRARGVEGLAAVLEQLDGVEAPAAAWETHLLPARVDRYDLQWLDMLCMSGRVAWGRRTLAPANSNGRGAARPLRATRIALFSRASAARWIDDAGAAGAYARVSGGAQQAYDWLAENGASFFHEIVAGAHMLPTQVERALGELAANGLATADGFAGLRALLTPENKRPRRARRRGGVAPAYGIESAGRWSVLRRVAGDRVPSPESKRAAALEHEAELEAYARMLLRRWGVVFRRVVTRERGAPAWRELVFVLRRLEARGEIRGGRFVEGPLGEQFALPEAIPLLRSIRRDGPTGSFVVISAADPLNLVGIVTPEPERVPALARNRIAFRDGMAVAARIDGTLRRYPGAEDLDDDALRTLLARGRLASPAQPLNGLELRMERWRARGRGRAPLIVEPE
ncbi:MAG TPA: DEAD/DEAH box helicase [Longimicrobiales bacterium]|nr:DEAD/DEAH box helicase [Longimicrobiales bacterium]